MILSVREFFEIFILFRNIFDLLFSNSIEMTHELSGQADFRLKLDARLHTGQQYNEIK